MATAQQLELAVRIVALVEGLNNVSQLNTELQDLDGTAGKPLPDSTRPLREGAAQTTPKVSELASELSKLASLTAIAAFVKTAVDDMKKAESAFKGLESVSKFAGISIGESFGAASQLAADGLITVTDASKSLQNLLSRGYNLDEAINTINRLKDAAAFNRQASLSMSEAVLNATEGLKNENSILVDNAGVTQNVAKMWEIYAKQIGVSVTALTQSQKVQAEVTGIIRETQAQLGNAEKAAAGMEGSFAKLTQTSKTFSTAFGGDLGPAVEFVLNGLTGLVDIAKHAAVGLNVIAYDAGALVTSLGDLKNAVLTLNFDGLGEKITRNFELAREMAIETVERYEKGITPAIQQATAATVAHGEAGQKAGAAIEAGQGQAQVAVENTAAKMEDAAKQIEGLFKSFSGGDTPQDLEAFSDQVAKLGSVSKEAGEKAKESWDKWLKSLTGEQLARFAQTAQTALVDLDGRLNESTRGGAQLADILDGALREGISRFGLDADAALTGVSSKTRENIANLHGLSSTLLTLGVDARRSGEILGEALLKTAGAAKTRGDIDAVTAALTGMGKEGVVSTDALKQGFSILAAESLKLKGAIDLTNTSFNQQLALSATQREFAQAARFRAIQAQNDAQKEAAIAEQKHANASREIQDGERLTVSYDMATAALLAFGEAGGRAIAELGRQAGGSFDLYFRFANAWTADANRQLTEVDRITARLRDAATSGDGLAEAIKEANQDFDKLDGNRLEGLNAALDAANQKMLSLQDSAQSTLQTLQAEFIQLTGNAEQQEAYAFEQKRLALQQQLEKARQAGNAKAIADLNQALALEQKIHAVKLGNLLIERQAQARSPALPAASAPGRFTAPGPATSGATTTQNVIRLELAMPGGTIPATVPGRYEQDLRGLLRDKARAR